MSIPGGDPPWFGLSEEKLRALEVHQARAVAIPGRSWRDYRDAAMLFSAGEREPFFNRLVGVRWPEEPRAFDARLAQAIELFAALDRKPYIWAIPGLSRPADLVQRLAANGFVDQGGGLDMILAGDPQPGAEVALPRGAVLEKWNCPSPAERPVVAEALTTVIGDAFHIPGSRRSNLVAEISLTLETSRFHACLIRVDGEPVATGERYSFDGASYLSSIGTRPEWRGRGLGTLVTQVLVRDSLAAGYELIYLGVYAENTSAIRVYSRLGFRVLGSRSADMLLESPRPGAQPRRPAARRLFG
jgi:ribosomal protein S18 acetylase RimI-like enzyme